MKMSSLIKLRTWIYDELSLPVVILVCLTLLTSPLFQPLLIIYTCYKWKRWILFWFGYFLWTEYDSKTLKTTGRKMDWLKNFITPKNVGRYYPLRLIKVADLTPDRNYILACFPHGVIPTGVCLNLNSNTTKVAELFPSVDIRLVTVPCFFRFPLAREFFMAMGFCTTDKENMLYLLSSTPSKALVLFPGGLKEAHHSRPGNKYTIVKNRKGFIRVALESGSPLVPVFSFGEQNTFELVEFKSPVLIYLNELFYKCTRAKLGILKGRRFFGRYLGINLPHRRPVTTVVGKPIEVPKIDNPSAALVDEYHDKFYKALYDLFEEYKTEYDEAGDAAQLTMI